MHTMTSRPTTLERLQQGQVVQFRSLAEVVHVASRRRLAPEQRKLLERKILPGLTISWPAFQRTSEI